jgi:predicted CoA-binding protein
MNYSEILNKYKKIAVVGYSANPARPSHWIAEYLLKSGYEVYGVNPGLEGRCVNEINCYSSLKELPVKVDIVNVFRRPSALPELMNEIMNLDYKPDVIWTQIGVVNAEARKIAEENEIKYIENLCIYVEHQKI